MDASRISFSNHTREMLANPILDKKKKSQLRENRVKDYIRSRPHGAAKLYDLIAAAGYRVDVPGQYASGWAFVNRMVRDGVIRKQDLEDEPRSYLKQWVIPEDAKIIKPANVPEEGNKTENPVDESPDRGQALFTVATSIAQFSHEDLLTKAKKFAWERNSDSLREFMTWLQEDVTS